MRLSWSTAACGLLALLVSPAVVFAIATPDVKAAADVRTHHLPYRLVTQLPDEVWIENIAVRSNGNLLLTTVHPNASLYEVQDPSSQSPKVTLLFTIDTINSLFGIAETSPDVFAVAGGNFDFITGTSPGSYALWSVDFSKGATPNPKLITSLPGAYMINGVGVVPSQPNNVLLADSTKNVIWHVDIKTANVSLAVVPRPAPGHTLPAPILGKPSIGINGVHVNREGLIVWSDRNATANPTTGQLETAVYLVPTTKDGYQLGHGVPDRVLTLPTTALDDFTWGPGYSQTLWIATNLDNRVFAVKKGEKFVVAGDVNSPEFATATACQFGRTAKDRSILYVTTGGVINGTYTRGGRVQALDTTGFC
ncbi:Putative hetero-Diels-Alderase [Cladobotryum mycophilum]|uniref:Hetero-Diels-Alderase n=1 Tax=Cladobotryum mycophilum TaxID=491253 RepID=A0ABR0SIA8_9HYPO